jgi:nucleotide-binding universal stress UspA family protein
MDRVNIRVEKSGRSVAVELMSEFSRGGYGTLVMGRRGVGGWEAMFPGSVSDRVMHSDIKGCIAIAG